MRKLLIGETQRILLGVMVDFDCFCREEGLSYYMIGGTMLGAYRHKGFIPWDDDIDVGMVREEYEKFIVASERFGREIKNYRVSDDCDYVITRIYIPGTMIENPSLKYTKLDQRLYFDIFPLDYAPNDVQQQKHQAKMIYKLKKKKGRMDFKIYDRNVIKNGIKLVLAEILSFRRRQILTALDDEMRKFSNTNYLCSMGSQYEYKRQLFDMEVYGRPTEYEFEEHKFYGPEKPEIYLNQLYGENYMQLPPVEKRRSAMNIYADA